MFGIGQAPHTGVESMPPTVERKLTTVLCADVEGYSRLMVTVV